MTALELPDEPRWVEAHGMAAAGDSWQQPCGGGIAIGHDRAALIVIAGDVGDGDPASALASAHPAHTILVADDAIAARLRGDGRVVGRAILHTLPDPERLPDDTGAIELPRDQALTHLPRPLAAELAHARSPVWTVFLDGLPVTFAYAPWQSARWFDVSVDTLASARQLGLATRCAAAMIRHHRADGREPVWGADEDNRASLALAHRLGFVACDELWVAAPSPR